MGEVVDTLYLLRSDTATNTEIYYHKTVKLIQNNDWVGIYVPIFIAALALGFSLWQFYLQRKEKKIKSIPHIDFRIKKEKVDEDDIRYKYTGTLINRGLGPAKINHIQYIALNNQDKRYMNLFDLILAIFNYSEQGKIFDLEKSYFSEDFEIPSYINSESEIIVFKLLLKKDLYEDPESLNPFTLSGTQILIGYESIYEYRYPEKVILFDSELKNRALIINSIFEQKD